jgi:hypothetical protein
MTTLGPKSTGSQPDKPYVPAVGDVVEFEYRYSCNDGLCKGLTFASGDSVWVWHNGEGDVHCGNVSDRGKKNFRKIGSSEITPSTSRDESEAIAKAYFATKADPVFEGTYAQRQAQAVKHYGWVVGSKVKVVRAYSTDEDGYNGMGHNSKGHTGNIEVVQGRDGIKLDTMNDSNSWFPYFALEPVQD